jgi:dimethylamine/trimethylamine dehydrogenase
MRGIKAEGGWAVVSTEEVEIHPSSDLSPYIEGRLWDDRDVPALALMTDSIHKFDALAAIELVHAGMNATNLYSREVSIAPSHIVNPASYALHRRAAYRKPTFAATGAGTERRQYARAERAIYVYADHRLSLAMHFLQSRHNHRTRRKGTKRNSFDSSRP